MCCPSPPGHGTRSCPIYIPAAIRPRGLAPTSAMPYLRFPPSSVCAEFSAGLDAGNTVPLTPKQRSQRARQAARCMHAAHDTKETTKKARAAFHEAFLRRVDPTNSLPEPERLRRAEALKKAHFQAMANKSAKVRSARAETGSSSACERRTASDIAGARGGATN